MFKDVVLRLIEPVPSVPTFSPYSGLSPPTVPNSPIPGKTSPAYGAPDTHIALGLGAPKLETGPVLRRG
jgi:hypothetical protein